jgi:hypothetical protein
VITGGCVSLTVTVNEQLGPAVELQLTVVVPFGKNEPEGGEQVTVPQPGVAFGAKVTIAPHWFASLLVVMFAGQVKVQVTTVTVNEQLAILFAASLTEQLTVVVPVANIEPLAGVHTGVPTPGQLSLAAGAG